MEIFKIREAEIKDCESIVEILNKYLSFGLCKDTQIIKDILNKNVFNYVCEYNNLIIGYISCKIVDIENDFDVNINDYIDINKSNNYIITHVVVEPNFRLMGIGKILLQAITDKIVLLNNDISYIFCIGWVRSDTKIWDAEKLFLFYSFFKLAYIKSYFSINDSELPCPYCKKYCKCDGTIYLLKI